MRVLFLTHRLPYPPDRGDRIRAYHILRHLKTYATVDLIALVHSRQEAADARALADLTASVQTVPVPSLRNRVRGALGLGTCTPLTHFLLDAPGIRHAIESAVAANPPDIVLAFCSGMARFALEPPLDRFPFVLEMVDVDSRKWQELGERKHGPLGWVYRREARYLSRFEAEAARRARTSVVVNERERDILKALAPGARVEAVPIGVDVAQFAPTGPPIPSQDVVFCGVMNYTLNVDGAVWMAREVWPRVLAVHPDARLRIVGSSPTSAVQALANAAQRIEVTGRVPDVRPYLWSGAVSVAPLLNARGVQTKVLEAIGAGLPCVVTPAVSAGLPSEVLPACVVATSAGQFAHETCRLLAMAPVERRALVDQVPIGKLGWMERLAPFRSILEDAAASERRR